MISQGSICTSHESLAIYLNELYTHKLLPLYKKTLPWEGLFIERKKLNEKIILGNVYRPPRERNENY